MKTTTQLPYAVVRTWIGIILVATVFSLPVTTVEAVLTAGNGFYNVHIQEAGASLGQYTITTGPQHPSGEGLNVLFGNGSPGTSYNSIRSFSSGTTYAQDGTTAVLLGRYGVITPLGTTGFRTTYTLPGLPTTADALTIVQDLVVIGNSFSNSTVNISTTIINNGSQLVRVGVRYLWDFQVARDDGPSFQRVSPDGAVLLTEAEFVSPQFQAFRIVDNDVNDAPPTFAVFGTVVGPSSVNPTPTRPTRMVHASWSASQSSNFDYTPDPDRVVCVFGQVNDNAVLYYFGHNATNALTIAAGAQRRCSASIFLTPPGFTLPGIEELPCASEVPEPSPTHGGCITRNARFWFTHPVDIGTTNCVTLLKAIEANGGGINLGFMCLPVTYRNSDNVANAEDSLIEALGFFYRSRGFTGEYDGKQDAKYLASKLCKERKRLAVELIAATANIVLLGTDPGNCSANGSNFPSNLLAQATAVAAGEDIAAIKTMTTQMKKFNQSGVVNDFPPEWAECSAYKTKELKKYSSDATSYAKCPGMNDTCDSAQAVVSFPANLTAEIINYRDSFGSPSCADGGANAVWKISPSVAAQGRQFTVSSEGSNIDTLLSVWTGTSCGTVSEINCHDNVQSDLTYSKVTFTANGTNTYWIVGEGASGQLGKLKLRITSY